MNIAKTFILFAVSFLALALVSSALVSATTLSFSATPSDLTLRQNSSTIELRTDSVSDLTISPLIFTPATLTAAGGASLTLKVDPSTSFVITSTTPKSIRVFFDAVSGVFPFGTYSTTLNATGTEANGTVITTSVPVKFVQSFCKSGSVGGNLTLDRIDISSTGDKDEEWRLLDSVDVEVRVENNGNNDLDDVQVELALFDDAGQNWVSDLDFSSSDDEQVNVGNLNDGDKETVNFRFKVPADFETGNYKLAVKVYSDDTGESNECDDNSNDLSDTTFERISVENEDEDEKTIVVDEIRLPEQTTCKEIVTGTFKVFNIGDEDQDQVLITMKNAELGLNKEFVIRQNLDKGDEDTLDFAFDVPATARDGTYSIVFKTFYDYDDGDDSYDQESEDEFSTTLKVIGCSPAPSEEVSDVSIDAKLTSDALPGQELKVTVTFRNDGTEDARISLSAEGYESWGDLASISRRSFTVGAGDEQEVTFTFDVNADVSGSESFLITPTINGKQESQEVEVDFGTSGTGSGFDFSRGSSLIWIIGIINVVLIVLIIVVAVKLSRR